jgi:hypothetical protein
MEPNQRILRTFVAPTEIDDTDLLARRLSDIKAPTLSFDHLKSLAAEYKGLDTFSFLLRSDPSDVSPPAIRKLRLDT